MQTLNNHWDELLKSKLMDINDQYIFYNSLNTMLELSKTVEQDCVDLVLHMRDTMKAAMYTPYGKNLNYFYDKK